MRRFVLILATAVASLTLFAGPAAADPGPGSSQQCAPGQHSGPTLPGSCDNK
jgi:hypothetical protein